MEVRRLGNYLGHDSNFAGTVYDKDGLSPTLRTPTGGNTEPMVIEETRCFAVRYRKYMHEAKGEDINPPHCEFAGDGMPNTLTSVQKDNLILERNMESLAIDDFYPSREERVFKDIAPTLRGERNGLKTVEEKPFVVDAYNRKRINGDVCGTLTAYGNQSSTHCGTFLLKEDLPEEKPFTELEKERKSQEVQEYRIRKLTPRECWRLMSFKDSDFEKAEKVVSSTQLYKQAGNSIAKFVLMGIFLQLNIQNLKSWNKMTESEIKELIYGNCA